MFLEKISNRMMSVDIIFISINALRMSGVYLISTIFAPFQKSIGIPLYEMAILEALFWIVYASMEIPTGVIADKRGRAWSVKIGTAFFGLGMFVYSLAFNFWSALTAEMLIAIGMAFNSGSSDAWLTDALTREGRLEALGKVQASSAKWNTYIAIVCGSGGAYIGKYTSYRMVWFVGGIALVFGFIIAMWQMNGQGEVIKGQGDEEELQVFWSTVRDSQKKWLSNRSLQWITAVSLAFPLSFVFNHYWPIYFSGPKGMQDNLGIVWIIFFPAYMIGPWALTRYHHLRSKNLEKDSSPRGCEDMTIKYEKFLVLLAVMLSGAGLVGAGFSQSLPLGLIFCMIHEIGRGLFRPIAIPFVHHRINSKYRATYDSLQSMINSVAVAVVYLICSAVLKGQSQTAETVGRLWINMGAALILLTLLLFLLRPRKS